MLPFPIDLLHSVTQELHQRNPFSFCSGTKNSDTEIGLGWGQGICWPVTWQRNANPLKNPSQQETVRGCNTEIWACKYSAIEIRVSQLGQSLPCYSKPEGRAAGLQRSCAALLLPSIPTAVVGSTDKGCHWTDNLGNNLFAEVPLKNNIVNPPFWLQGFLFLLQMGPTNWEVTL